MMKAHHGNDASGAASADQALGHLLVIAAVLFVLDVGIALCGCGKWADLRAESRRVLESERVKMTEPLYPPQRGHAQGPPPDGPESPKTGDPGNDGGGGSPSPWSDSRTVPPAPGSA